MKIFTPNTVIASADMNLNLDELKTVTDSYTAKGFVAPDSAWITPTFTNNWVNYSATFNDCGYMKDANGFVHLRGLVKSGTDGSSIFTLPVGYRPIRAELLVCASADHYGRLDIATTGTVAPSAATTENGWVGLDGIVFKAGQ